MAVETFTNDVKDLGNLASRAVEQVTESATQATNRLVQEVLGSRDESIVNGSQNTVKPAVENMKVDTNTAAGSATKYLPTIDIAEIVKDASSFSAKAIRNATDNSMLIPPGSKEGWRQVADATEKNGLVAGAGAYMYAVVNGDINDGMNNPLYVAKQRANSAREFASQLPNEGFGGMVKNIFEMDAKTADLTVDFIQATYAAAVQDPVDGIVQLTNMATGAELSAPQIIERPKEAETYSASWFAQTAGTGVGIIAPIFLTGGTTSAIGRAGTVASIMERAPLAARSAELLEQSPRLAQAAKYAPHMLKSALDGGLSGFLLQPSNESDGLYGRVVNGVNGLVSLPAMKVGSVASLYAVGKATGQSLEHLANSRTISQLADSAGGTAAGILSVTASSLAAGRGLPSREELVQSIVQDTVTGGLMDGARIAREANASRPTNESPQVRPEQPAVRPDLPAGTANCS